MTRARGRVHATSYTRAIKPEMAAALHARPGEGNRRARRARGGWFFGESAGRSRREGNPGARGDCFLDEPGVSFVFSACSSISAVALPREIHNRPAPANP